MNDKKLTGKEILETLFRQFGKGPATTVPFMQNRQTVALREGNMSLTTELRTNIMRLEVFSSQQLGEVMLTIETSREDPRTLIVIPWKKPFDLGDPVARETTEVLFRAAELVPEKQFAANTTDLALK